MAELISEPVLDYGCVEEDPRAGAALLLSWMMAGTVGYGALSVFIFVMAVWLRAPDLICVLPLTFAASVVATGLDHLPAKWVGVGSVVGAVLMWTVGYGLSLMILSSP